MDIALINDVRNYLDMTWNTNAAELKKLGGIIMRGEAYLNGTAGKTLDYAIEGKPREMLFEYARYVMANALPDFVRDYTHELVRLRLEAVE